MRCDAVLARLTEEQQADLFDWLTIDTYDVLLKRFVKSYNLKNRHNRKESERFKSFAYEGLIKRDKANLDIFRLRDASLEDSASLPDPDILAQEIVDDLEAALEQFATIADDLKK